MDQNSGDVVKHYRIRNIDDGGYYITTRISFTSLSELVKHYSRTHSFSCMCSQPQRPQYLPTLSASVSASPFNSTECVQNMYAILSKLCDTPLEYDTGCNLGGELKVCMPHELKHLVEECQLNSRYMTHLSPIFLSLTTSKMTPFFPPQKLWRYFGNQCHSLLFVFRQCWSSYFFTNV